MNKITVILVALIIALAVTVAPISAQTNTQATTSVQVSSGGGSAPVIKVKWEQDTTTTLEDGDILHKLLGAQFLPTCVYKGDKIVEYYAVVTDVEDGGDVKQVWADVYHPLDSWATANNFFKYEVPFTKITDNAVGKTKFLDAVKAGLVKFNTGYTEADVVFELEKGTARVWTGSAPLDYEQPGGDYTVKDRALDFNDNPSGILENTFTYIKAGCFETDNDKVDYGGVSISKMKVIPGDIIFQKNADNKMTVRNLGNSNLNLKIRQDDMGFGKDQTGKWNVQFDARIGHIVPPVVYDPSPLAPYLWTVIPGKLPHSTDEELDLSIHVIKGLPGNIYTGILDLAVDSFDTAP